MNLSICLSPCPCLCPFDWKTRWKEGRNHCGFVLLTPPLIGPEPMFDSPQPPVPQPVGHIREMTHRPKSEPGLECAQEKHLQHKVRIQNTTSLQTSPSLSRSRRSWSSHALRSCVTIAVYSVSFLVPAKTICRSSRERRAFWRSRYPRISSSKKV